MKNILVLGAGRSSSSLIAYLLEHAAAGNWQVTVGDVAIEAAQARVAGHARGKAITFDIHQDEAAAAVIADADVVVSLLPAHFHPLVARHAVHFGRHLLTASYVSDDMKAFDAEARQKGLLLLNECGLDPGIDHMSAMQVIDRIRAAGHTLTSFESFTGGLIAPETDPNNPWRYKFTWNPRNVVMAGQGTAKYLQQGIYKYIPYQQLFARTTAVHVPGYGDYEGYANRDSLKYIDTYQLQGIQTMLRGTLRHAGYCSTWHVLVQLGCCDDTYAMEGVAGMTHRDFIASFLPAGAESVEEKLTRTFNLRPDGPELERLRWSTLLDAVPIGLRAGTPAQVLEHILNKKWQLAPEDKDLIVMWHRFRYLANGVEKEIQASLVAKGDDAQYTAMAKTVGLPLAIAARLVLEGRVQARGVVIPTTAEFYQPILDALRTEGVALEEREM